MRVVEEQGFSAAARVLGLPKSSVSRGVAQLEAELGVRLLQRSTRAVQLTAAGQAFYERASRALAGLQEAAEAATEHQATMRGTIRVTAPLDVGTSLLAPLLASFARQHPGVHVEVALTGRRVNLVEEGFDLALRAGEVGDGSLIARPLQRLCVALFASREYLARRGVPATVASLAEHECVLFRPAQGRALWTLQGPRGEERVEVRGPVGGDDFTFLRAAVQGGAGIGLLPAVSGGEGLERVLPEHQQQGAPFHLVYPAAPFVPQRVVLLREHLLASLAVSRASRGAHSRGAGPRITREQAPLSSDSLSRKERVNPSNWCSNIPRREHDW